MIQNASELSELQSQSQSEDSAFQHFDGVTSSEDEFDLERFRLSKTVVPKVLDPSSSTHSQQAQGNLEKEILTVLGIDFVIAYLQERNRNPILLLQVVAFCAVAGNIVTTMSSMVGTNFDPIQCSLSTVFELTMLACPVIFLKKSIKNGLKYTLGETLLVVVNFASPSAMIIYSFMVKSPFDSIPLFLSTFFITALFYMMQNACTVLYNPTNKNDPEYQLKFFFKRIMLSVINATGYVDVLSDIALGIQIIQKYTGYLKVLGVFMFIFCILDFLIVNFRFAAPEKVTVGMHAWAIALEVMILAVSILSVLQVDSKDIDWDFLLLLVFSLVSTAVNFLHHIFVIVQWQFAKRKQRKAITFVEVFEE
eukprot:TRINITY_DN2711_c0_g1_i1.p3 TRINITY_DN2711_c0_g1~~TRINITY_DN2711_c0_g1_i1.p3  ORF type:complete len:365 (+),score=33.07 TRINITY_DN2711_c0_g1_i1:215-1309(+)